MALFDLFLASFTAFIASFLSFSPTIFYGLVPWIDMLSNRPPMAPTPSALPKALFLSDFWKAIPTANLSAPDTPAPPPTSTSIFLFDEDEDDCDDDESSDEPTTAELIWELWRLVKKVVQLLTININRFINEHPYLPSSPLASLSLPDNYRPPTIAERLLRLKTERREQRNTIRELKQEVKDLRLQIERMRLAPAPAMVLTSPQPSQIPTGQLVFATGPKPPSTQLQRFDFGRRHSRTPQPFIFSCTPPPERSNQPLTNGQAGAKLFSLDGFLKNDSK
ncbi:hypothetical protein MMC29_005355 [Sticta canariensis]|nr:hypothetical protein [Sticta canariensis]